MNDKVIATRVTIEEHEALQKIADSRGVNISKLIRILLEPLLISQRVKKLPRSFVNIKEIVEASDTIQILSTELRKNEKELNEASQELRELENMLLTKYRPDQIEIFKRRKSKKEKLQKV